MPSYLVRSQPQGPTVLRPQPSPPKSASEPLATPTPRPAPTQATPRQMVAQPPATQPASPQQPTAPQRGARATPILAGQARPAPTPATPSESAESDEQQEAQDDLLAKAKEFVSHVAIELAPPWLVSLLVHLAVIIGLALVYLREDVKSIFVVELAYGEQLGEQMIDDTQFDNIETLEVDPAVSLDSEPVLDPLAALPELKIELDIVGASTNLTAPSIGIALSGREKGAKRALLAAYGGTGETEGSVGLALEWLQKNQQSDGTWRLDGPYGNGSIGTENRVAATAMALLAFQGSGDTHLDGEYARVVQRGKDALLKMQDLDGCFFSTQSLQIQHQLYSQAQATIAICELYGMTKDPDLQKPAQRAIDYAVSIQADADGGGGGWRYSPGQGADTSVAGWFVIALQSGQMSQLNVSHEALRKVSLFLDSVTSDGIHYAYRAGESPKISMTAEALLCRQYLGWSHSDPRLIQGMQAINAKPIDWDPAAITEIPSAYYWYYATQVAHHMGGDDWEKWNQVLRKEIPKAQVKSGRERGSWSPAGDQFGSQGGRLYMTCLCTYMLEVYYRHLPVYKH
ncbi:MAG: squalene--hopene cyclase [Planctomycetaceae bacterium]|nr:squalene--hopene cyclase [Planctomycetaceae bacterium]